MICLYAYRQTALHQTSQSRRKTLLIYFPVKVKRCSRCFEGGLCCDVHMHKPTRNRTLWPKRAVPMVSALVVHSLIITFWIQIKHLGSCVSYILLCPVRCNKQKMATFQRHLPVRVQADRGVFEPPFRESLSMSRFDDPFRRKTRHVSKRARNGRRNGRETHDIIEKGMGKRSDSKWLLEMASRKGRLRNGYAKWLRASISMLHSKRAAAKRASALQWTCQSVSRKRVRGCCNWMKAKLT
jgi:hypothetical protein